MNVPKSLKRKNGQVYVDKAPYNLIQSLLIKLMLEDLEQGRFEGSDKELKDLKRALEQKQASLGIRYDGDYAFIEELITPFLNKET